MKWSEFKESVDEAIAEQSLECADSILCKDPEIDWIDIHLPKTKQDVCVCISDYTMSVS